MAVTLEYTPVRAPAGRRIHAVTLLDSEETACGYKLEGWRVALAKLNCHRCKLAVGLDCRPKKKR